MTDPGFDPADIQPFKFGYGTGHYTQEFNRMMLRIMVMVDDNDDGGDVGDENEYQVVWAETSQVGCGWAYYRFTTPPSSLWL